MVAPLPKSKIIRQLQQAFAVKWTLPGSVFNGFPDSLRITFLELVRKYPELL